MSPTKRLRRAIQNKLPLEKVRMRFNDAVRLYEKYDNSYDHPLHYAARYNYAKMLEILVKQFDCDIDMKNCDDHTPFDIAIYSCNVRVCRKLMELGARIPTSISLGSDDVSTYNKRVDLIEFLIFHQIANVSDIHENIKFKFTSLSEEMMILMIATGFDINKQYRSDRLSPLMCHVKYYDFMDYHSINRLKLILAAGADTSLADANGKNVFDYVDDAYNIVEHLRPRAPKHTVLKLLTEGVSKEYQEEFDEKIQAAQCRVYKRKVCLFDLLWQQLGIKN